MNPRRHLQILALVATVIPCRANAAESLTIDTAVRYQTVRSWGAPAGLIGNPDSLLDPLLDELVETLGLTRLRFEPPRREWEDAVNDDADPFHVNPDAFQKPGTDLRVSKIFLPFKRRVEARGEHFEFYVSPSFFDGGSSGTAPAWLLNSPGEYMEWACAFLQYLRSRHNLHADFYSICNEAGNNNTFTAGVVAAMIKALAPHLEALGFRTRIEFPECVSADTSWSYIQNTQNDAELWRWVGLVSYHLYGGNNSRTNIRDFTWTRNLPTGQTEYMGLNLNWLYDDLTLGGVSTWEYYALNDILPVNSSRTWFSRTQTFWQTRQVLRFVRPGAVRVGVTTSTNALRALAFLHHERTTLVLITDSQARSVEVSGLTAGVYGRSQTADPGSVGAARELGLFTVTNSNPVTMNMPAYSVLTLYPYPGSNVPPLVTGWRATPSFLTQPASTTTLSATATDPETNVLTYAWAVLSSPPGANVGLNTPTSASCTATGLIVAGNYLFQVSVSDGADMVTRRLPLQVFSGNQPPELLDVHNRLPVTVTLPTQYTTLRCGGRDLEGDPLTYQWSIVSQPAGASALLLSPTNPACVATNLTPAGDYVFRIELRDPTHAVSNDLRVTVYPTNRAPVIGSATASPASLTLPSNGTMLSGATSDPEGEPVSHWWTVNSAPAGALPIFASQGSNVTIVSGLILPGTYTFKLTAVDRAGVATRNVSVTVDAGASPPLLFLASPNGGETYSARQTITIRWSSFQVSGDVKLECYDGRTWTTIADTTPNDGVESWTLPTGTFGGCRVRISPVGGGVTADESDGTFSITASTPRFQGIFRTNGVPVLHFDQEQGWANYLLRANSLAATSLWETVAVVSNEAQTVVWPDASASNLPVALYRILAQP